jgi:putative sterol carrier protein
MSKYLSQEWLDEFVALAADQPTRPGATVKIQYKVTGGPDGDIDYYWAIDEGKILDAKLGTIDAADFTMTNTYDDGAKIQRGEMDPTAAFMQGKIKASGNMAKMMSLLPITNSPEWKALQEKVNSATEY